MAQLTCVVCVPRVLSGTKLYLRLSVGLCLNKLYTFRNLDATTKSGSYRVLTKSYQACYLNEYGVPTPTCPAVAEGWVGGSWTMTR